MGRKLYALLSADVLRQAAETGISARELSQRYNVTIETVKMKARSVGVRLVDMLKRNNAKQGVILNRVVSKKKEVAPPPPEVDIPERLLRLAEFDSIARAKVRRLRGEVTEESPGSE